MNQQQNKVLKRNQRGYHSHIPKGSYHNYCRHRLYQQQQQFLTRIHNTRGNSRSFQTHRSTHTPRVTPLNTALTFQQYLQQLDHPLTAKSNTQRPNTTNIISKHSHANKKEQNGKQTKQNSKIQNQQIIDSHLPFFKCKLEKTQVVIKKSDFRVKQNKFKIHKNIVQNNCLMFLGESLPLRNF